MFWRNSADVANVATATRFCGVKFWWETAGCHCQLCLMAGWFLLLEKPSHHKFQKQLPLILFLVVKMKFSKAVYFFCTGVTGISFAGNPSDGGSSASGRKRGHDEVDEDEDVDPVPRNVNRPRRITMTIPQLVRSFGELKQPIAKERSSYVNSVLGLMENKPLGRGFIRGSLMFGNDSEVGRLFARKGLEMEIAKQVDAAKAKNQEKMKTVFQDAAGMEAIQKGLGCTRQEASDAWNHAARFYESAVLEQIRDDAEELLEMGMKKFEQTNKEFEKEMAKKRRYNGDDEGSAGGFGGSGLAV